MNRTQSSTEEPTYDKACQLTFKSWMEYHRHKLATPRRHITCEVCSQDFKTLDARKRHHDLVGFFFFSTQARLPLTYVAPADFQH
jgi:hypothetical protein